MADRDEDKRNPSTADRSHQLALTTGWLLGDITQFDNQVHTPSSGWGHYPTTHEVIPLFVSA